MTMKPVWLEGEKAWFEYRGIESHFDQDAYMWYRSHQQATIIGEFPTFAGHKKVYMLEFADGGREEASVDELFTDTADFERQDPPKLFRV